jgi:hypothetical protein
VLYKKRWSDGLHDDFEHLNEFELKFGLFGGDGGGSSGGGSTKPGYDPSAQEPTRGRPTSPAPEMSTISAEKQDVAKGIQDAVGSAVFDSGFYDVGPQAPVAGISLADIAPTAMAPGPQTTAPGPSPSAAQTASFGPSLADISMAAPSISAPSMSAPTSVGQAIANAQNLGFGSVPGTDTFGYNTQVGPGTLGIGTNLSGDIGLGYSMKFAKGGEVHQGIGSLMRRR